MKIKPMEATRDEYFESTSDNFRLYFSSALFNVQIDFFFFFFFFFFKWV